MKTNFVRLFFFNFSLLSLIYFMVHFDIDFTLNTFVSFLAIIFVFNAFYLLFFVDLSFKLRKRSDSSERKFIDWDTVVEYPTLDERRGYKSFLDKQGVYISNFLSVFLNLFLLLYFLFNYGFTS